jgi:hypothetical protein
MIPPEILESGNKIDLDPLPTTITILSTRVLGIVAKRPLDTRGAQAQQDYQLQGINNNNTSSHATIKFFMLLITGCDINQIVSCKNCIGQADCHGTTTMTRMHQATMYYCLQGAATKTMLPYAKTIA